MRRVLLATGLALVIGTLVVSCVKSDPEADKTAIRGLVEEDTVHFRGGTAGDSTENGSLLDDTTVGLWWRGPQTHDPQATIEVGVSGDSAWVGWHQSNYGDFIHWAKTSDTTSTKWTKELVERVQINAIFRREAEETAEDRGWVFKRISLASGRSDTANTVRIDSLRIQSSLRDVMIRNPLETYYRLDSLVTFTPLEQLTLTLYTNVPEGRAFLHAFWLWLLVRAPFENQGDGVYVGTWNAQLLPGFRFAIFDLITESTLLDPTAPYDYCGWLFPYDVHNAD
jgi:hypothetical protein